ncbi:MAG: hypothetical protein NC191_08505 [Muribaculaceae bacterium]|nr:hypothetical protein [Muribaculaceae bacterium]
MMVNPVSAVNFRGTMTGTNPLEREGAFSSAPKTEAAPEAPVKKKSTGKKIAKAVAAVAVVAAALAGLNKFGVTKVLDAVALEGAGFMQKAGHYLGKAGEFVAKYTYEPIVKLFKRTPSA